MKEIDKVKMLISKLAKKPVLDKKDKKDLDKLKKSLKKYKVIVVINDTKKIYPLKYKQ